MTFRQAGIWCGTAGSSPSRRKPLQVPGHGPHPAVRPLVAELLLLVSGLLAADRCRCGIRPRRHVYECEIPADSHGIFIASGRSPTVAMNAHAGRRETHSHRQWVRTNWAIGRNAGFADRAVERLVPARGR
jgi:hypothetical protein